MTPETMFSTAAFFGGLGYFGAALASALGVGAALLFVPILLLLLPAFGMPAGMAPGVAVATSLAAAGVVSAASAWAHWKAGNVAVERLRTALPTMAAAGLGALSGGTFVSSVPTASITVVVVAAQLIVAALLLARLARGRDCTPGGDTASADNALGDWRTQVYVFAVGVLASIGASGVFLVSYFVWRGAAKARAAALASLLGVSISPVATAVYLAHHDGPQGLGLVGLVHAPIAAALAVGALFGAGLGARAARTTDTALWTRLLACVLLLSSVRAAARML